MDEFDDMLDDNNDDPNIKNELDSAEEEQTDSVDEKITEEISEELEEDGESEEINEEQGEEIAAEAEELVGEQEESEYEENESEESLDEFVEQSEQNTEELVDAIGTAERKFEESMENQNEEQNDGFAVEESNDDSIVEESESAEEKQSAVYSDAQGTQYIANIDEVVAISDSDKLEEENVTENVIAEVKEKVIKQKLKEKEQRQRAQAEDSAGDSGKDEMGIIYKNIDRVMHESMIPYSEFVIMDRALPRVEDGLKPVQRRILYAMNDMGLLPDRPFRKSAGIVGECLGKYHPHGDTSVYDAMVRLAQPFNLNMPLVLGQGNFGSDDGDPPAAMRYTEAKLSPLALELLRDIDKETVPFSLTFDDRNTEPDILPGRYPNLLTNGATGIAVGLATNIPPHNLGEVIDAHIAYIDNPKITLHQIMKIIKGPDFPTGGFVICGEDLQRAYKTGKGKVIMRAKIHIEVDGEKRNIIISELPYQVNKVVLQRNIADLREQKKGVLQGINEIRDESDRKGMRVVIKVKREFDPKEICDVLFKYTNLQCNYNINMVAIADGKPKLMGLMQMISYYVDYQRNVIYKRCVFDLENAKERAHILEGLLVAIKNIDEVVRIIKTSKHTTEARERLQKTFKLTERQAQAILDLRLARLTSLEVYKLEQELAELKILIKNLTAIIASEKLQFDVVKQELLEIKRKFKIDRRSRIITSLEEAIITADDDEKPVEEVVVTLTAAATVKRMPAKHFSMSKTEFAAGFGLYDVNQVVIQTQTNKLLYIFTNLGNCYKIDVGDIPECKLRDKGTKLHEIFAAAAENELAIAVYALAGDVVQLAAEEGGNLGELIWLTKLGMIKRSTWAEGCGVQKSVFQCYKLRDDRPDEVLRVDEFKQGRTILLVSGAGMVLNATTGDIPVQGRIAAGVKGISMADNDFAAGNTVAKPTGFLVVVTSKGNVKRTEIKGLEKMVRYRKGQQLGGGLDNGERIVFASWVKGDEDLVAQTAQGAIIFTPIEKIPVSDRTGKFKPFPGAGKVQIKTAFVHRRKRNN